MNDHTTSLPPISRRRVLQLALPVILANLSVPLLGAVDTAIVGHLDGPEYLAGLAIGSLVFSFLYWGFGFLRMGTTGFAAQALGAGDHKALGNSFAQALILALAIGSAIVICQSAIAWLAFEVLIGSEAAMANASAYFSIRVWSAPATMGTYAILGWLIGVQRTRDALTIQLWLNGLNVALDLLFVLGFGWGVEGVALGTAIAEYIALGVGLVLIRKRMTSFGGYYDRATLLAPGSIARLVSVNSDIFLRTLCLVSAFALVTREGGRMGDIMLDANAVLMTLQIFLSYGLDGFAHAVEGLCGVAYGARDRHAIRLAAIISTQLALATAVVFTLVYGFFGEFLVNLFTNIEEVRVTAHTYLPWLVASPLISVWCFQLDGLFIGTQRTRDMRNMMVIAFAAFLLVLYGGIDRWGNNALWGALMTFFAVRGITLALRYPSLERSAAADV